MRIFFLSSATLGALLGGLLAGVVWLFLADTPFLQDDYGFLYETIAAGNTGYPFRTLTLATGDGSFWRPLSVGLHWRFIVDVLQASPIAAHVFGVTLIAAASASVAMFSVLYVGLWTRKTAGGNAAFWSALLYGCHGAQFLPAAWACAVQETYAILWTSLALIGLVRFSRGSRHSITAGILSIIAVVLALLSKEGTVVLPLLGIALFSILRPSRKVVWVLSCWVLITALWLWGRTYFIAMPDAGTPYAPTLGINVVRNAALSLLFMLGLPREAILLWMTDRSIAAAVWGIVCCALQSAAWAILVWSSRADFNRRHMVFLAVFTLIALAPYLPLYSQAYSYYTLMALIPYGILTARVAVTAPRRVQLAAGCALASTGLLIIGERQLPFPAPVARADWAEHAIAVLREDKGLQEIVGESGELTVYAGDESRFAALGYGGGLALVFSLNKTDVHIQNKPTSATKVSITEDLK